VTDLGAERQGRWADGRGLDGFRCASGVGRKVALPEDTYGNVCPGLTAQGRRTLDH
jgi:hypothetical protein